MGPRCFRKKDSIPPACGVHNALLVQAVVSIDENAPSLGQVACSVCPVSNLVVDDLDPRSYEEETEFGEDASQGVA